MVNVINQLKLHVNHQISSVLVFDVCQLLWEQCFWCDHGLRPKISSFTNSYEMTVCTRKWPLFLWSLSALISKKTPFSCEASPKEKGSIFVSDENVFRRNYRLEDFFWTGSGDGPVGEGLLNNETDAQPQPINDDHYSTWRTTTIFHTTTILLATVYPNAESCSDSDCKPKISPVWTRSVEFSSPVHTSFYDIEPTPTQKYPERTKIFRNLTVFSEITKVLTVTERVTDAGKTYRIPAKTVANTPQSTVSFPTNFTGGIDESNAGEGSGAAFPRFDVDFNTTAATVHPSWPQDQKFWLLTVLKCDSFPNGVKVRVIEEKLSALYKKAFIRQQERHLGIYGNSVTTSRPRRDRRIPEPVEVHIHNVTDVLNKDSSGVALLYSVTVAGKPVPALTAANDMRLVPLNEVVAELGYPVLTKAEPYLKEVVPLGARVKGRSRDTWLLIGAVIAAVSLLIILAAVFTFGLSDREEERSVTRSTKNKKHIFEAEEGSSNLAFQEDSELKVKIDGSKYDNLGNVGASSGATVTFADQRRGSSSSSSCSGSSEASLVRLRYQQKKRDQRKEVLGEKPRPKPRKRIRRIQNGGSSLEGTLGSHGVTRGQDGEVNTEGVEDVELSPRMTRTPTSYLSMPSVKAFPRGARIPEPLSRVLEPISIRYLDGDPDNMSQHVMRRRVLEENCETDFFHTRARKFGKEKGMTRHASIEGDPGVVGPLVWKGQYLKHDDTGKDVFGVLEIDGNINVGKMRKRFNDLIDDAFSAFGSRNECEGQERCGNDLMPNRSDTRIHSAIIRPVESFYNFSSSSRPKTTDSKRPLAGAMSQGPRGAWDSPNGSTTSKPVVESTVIDKSSILVDSNLSPGDPAIPLIKAIKDELQKFDQGSTKHTDIVHEA